jgi:hypothetical protein
MTAKTDAVAGTGIPGRAPARADVEREPRGRWTSGHGAGVLRRDAQANASATVVSFGALGHGIAGDDRAAQLAVEAEPPR